MEWYDMGKLRWKQSLILNANDNGNKNQME